ncbi:MAG: E3 ubiquitin ligase family protein [Proteobacteria bacterium]|nr:E3 ubiquitin ligase family protein [Pseudomonadota bacterium]
MAIIGGILIIVAIICFVMRVSATKRLEQLAASGKQKIGEILSLYKETKASLGTLGEENTVAEQLTVMGDPRCDAPLMSPLGNIPCIYYRMRVTAKRRETYQERDSNGNMQTRTRVREDVLDQSTNSTRFTLDDGTGTVIVDPRDGQFEGTRVSVDRSETNFGSNQQTISLGRFSFDLASNTSNMSNMSSNMSSNNMSSMPNMSSNNMSNMSSNNVNLSLSVSSNSRPETVSFKEEIIGLDRRLTVVGTLCDKMGDLIIEKHGKTNVIVSTRSQDEMLQNATSSIKKYTMVASISAGLGVILLVIGLIVS